MSRTPWFERTFLALEDNGLLPGILERLDGTPHRLRALLAGVERAIKVESGGASLRSWDISSISNLFGSNVQATSLRAKRT